MQGMEYPGQHGKINIQWNLGILGTPKGLSKIALNSEVVLIFRSISMWWMDLGTGVAVLSSQVVPISQVVLKTGLTVSKENPGF